MLAQLQFLAWLCKTMPCGCFGSPHVRESGPIVDSRFQVLDSGFHESGFRIPERWIPDSKPQYFVDYGIRIPWHGAIWTNVLMGLRQNNRMCIDSD